jgi:hypothetical protein
MKRNILILTFGVSLFSGAAEAADVAVSIQFSQPGVYGRINVGQYPPPQVVVAQPILVAPPPPASPPLEPVYLWVPPGHRKHWEKYCHEYHACGHPVYFVDDEWYRRNVMGPHGHGHQDERGDRDDRGDHDHEHGHGHDRHEDD